TLAVAPAAAVRPTPAATDLPDAAPLAGPDGNGGQTAGPAGGDPAATVFIGAGDFGGRTPAPVIGPQPDPAPARAEPTGGGDPGYTIRVSDPVTPGAETVPGTVRRAVFTGPGPA